MIILIVPSYNEEHDIESLIVNTCAHMDDLGYKYKLLIINDGSSDRTAEIVSSFVEKLPVKLINIYPHKGVAEAFRVGFKSALEMAGDGDIIVTKEADNTSDLAILHKMIRNIEDGFDLSLASCYAKEGGIVNSSLDRKICSFFGNRLLKTFFKIDGVNTYSSFYRAYNTKKLRAAFMHFNEKFITENGFACMVEMLVKLNKTNIKIKEVPMVLKADRRKGISKMRRLNTISAYFRIVIKSLLKIDRF